MIQWKEEPSGREVSRKRPRSSDRASDTDKNNRVQATSTETFTGNCSIIQRDPQPPSVLAVSKILTHPELDWESVKPLLPSLENN
jgi:hypothetical protein